MPRRPLVPILVAIVLSVAAVGVVTAILLRGPEPSTVVTVAPTAGVGPTPGGDALPTTNVDVLPFLGTQVIVGQTANSSEVTVAELPSGRYGMTTGSDGSSSLVFDCNGRARELAHPDGTLPVQALLAAAEQFAGGQGCDPDIPDGQSFVEATSDIWAVPLIRLVDRARLGARFEFSTADELRMTITDNAALSVDLRLFDASSPTAPGSAADPEGTLVGLGDGEALVSDGDVVFQCHPDSVIVAEAGQESLETVIDLTICRPEPPI